MFQRFMAAAALVALGCSSSGSESTTTDSGSASDGGGDAGTPTSGGAHFEIAPFATTDPTLKCDDIGLTKDVAATDATGVKKLIVDGADGAVVNCQFDATRFQVQVVDPSGDSVSATGSISGGKSSDANVSIGFLGSSYSNPAATHCTIVFVCAATAGCGTDALPSGTSLEGHFLCPEIDNSRTAKECAVTGANPAGLSNSYFKFIDCKGF